MGIRKRTFNPEIITGGGNILRRFVPLLFLGFLCLLVVLPGFTEDDEEFDMNAVIQSAVENKDKFPKEIAALVPEGAEVTSHVYSADPFSQSFVIFEIYAELPNTTYDEAWSLYQKTDLFFKLDFYDATTETGRFTLDQVEDNKEVYYEESREWMDAQDDNCEPSKVVEVKNKYGLALYRKLYYPRSGNDFEGYTPEQTYYNCFFLGRVKDTFFTFRVQSLPASKDRADKWFNDFVGMLGKISVKQLLK